MSEMMPESHSSEEGIESILPDIDLEEPTKDNPPEIYETDTLLHELWPGAEVFDDEAKDKEEKIEKLLQEIYQLKEQYPDENNKVKRRITLEKQSRIEDFSEVFFTESEKARWNLEQRVAISGLVINGLLKFEQNEETSEERLIVANLDKFKNPDITWGELVKDMGSYPHMISRTKSQFEVYAQMSLDISDVISEESYGNGLYEDKGPLFYVPENDPLVIENLKNDRSQMGLWEATFYYPSEYPASSTEDVRSTYEVIPAYYVYHPRKGDGHRKEDGQLMAKLPDGREVKVTGRFFSDWGSRTRTVESKTAISDSPISYLENFPALVESDLLRVEDFRSQGGEYGYLSSHRLVGRETSHKGMVMIEGIRYTLGVEFGNSEGKKSKFEVTQISQDQYAIVEKIPVTRGHRFVVRKILDTYSPEEAEGYKRDSTPFPDIGKRVLDNDGRLLDLETYLQRHPQNADFINNFQENINILNKLESNGVSIDTSCLSISEQVNLLNFLDTRKGKYWVNEILKDRDLSPIDIESRLKTMVVLVTNVNDLESVGRVASLGGEAKPLFESVYGIVTSLSTLQDYLRNNVEIPPEKVASSEQIKEQILKYTSMLFIGSEELLRGGQVSVSEVSYILESYRRSVERWCNELLRSQEGNFMNTRYMDLLNKYEKMEEDGHAGIVISRMIIEYLEDDLKQDISESRNSKPISRNLENIKKFYQNNSILFESASETTGDTQVELDSLKNFFDRFEKIDGLVLDVGSGTGDRITLPMAKMLEGRAKVVGMDIYPPNRGIEQQNLDFIQGSMSEIPLPNNSVEFATLNWSVTNDLLGRFQQIESFKGLARVMKKGGIVRMDQAYLEGGKGSWFDLASEEYSSEAAKNFGDIHVEFPGGREGSFHIYPKAELVALLNNAGFTIKDVQVWYTKSGKPRFTIEAEYTGAINPL